MKKFVLSFFLMTFILISCEHSSNHVTEGRTGEMLGVTVDINREDQKDKAAFIVELKLRQENRPVVNADDVYLEVWRDGEEESKEIFKVKNQGEGIYIAELTLGENGQYFLMYHVTAERQHIMEKLPLTVNEGEATIENDAE